jgi:glutamate-ammonia-ligase adenylyltransferase
LATLARHRLLEGDAAERLADAYRAFRAVVHRNALQELPALATDDQLAAERALVSDLWRALMGA